MIIEKRVPKCSNVMSSMFIDVSPTILSKITKCPLDDMGKNSVKPCKIPEKISNICKG